MRLIYFLLFTSSGLLAQGNLGFQFGLNDDNFGDNCDDNCDDNWIVSSSDYDCDDNFGDDDWDGDDEGGMLVVVIIMRTAGH